MAEIIFLEGVSGVGKSTMCESIRKYFEKHYCRVRTYLEFDFTNPIDFYCTAYLSLDEYAEILFKYPDQKERILRYTHWADDARLVRYYDEDTPLFKGELLACLSEHEFCYNPTHPVPFEMYSRAYLNVWKHFAETLSDEYDFLIFDGSLIHHPVNDMMRNYSVSFEQANAHVRMLLESLGNTRTYVFYLETDDHPALLKKVYADRGQKPPTQEQIAFWKKRHDFDRKILQKLNTDTHVLNISDGKWKEAEEYIIRETAFDTEYDLKCVYDRVRHLVTVRWSESMKEDDGFTSNFPIIAGRANGRVFWLYTDGYFVFSYEKDGCENMHWHTHPQSIDEAVELILEFSKKHEV